MSQKKQEKSESARPYGNYITAEQDADSGLWVGVVTTSSGESGEESVLHRGTSMFRDEHDAIENVAAWCRDRGYQYQV